ncbi:hypothetical protein ACSQ67_016387 [Phaseolus vulgaris]
MEERQALLDLNSRFDPPFFFYWDVDTDCCEWEGVHCNSSTGRVAGLEFFLYESLKLHCSLLTSKYEYIYACYVVPHTHYFTYFSSLPNAELLEIGGTKLNTAADIVSCLDGLPSLKSLYLRYNDFNTSSFHVPLAKNFHLQPAICTDIYYHPAGDFITNMHSFHIFVLTQPYLHTLVHLCLLPCMEYPLRIKPTCQRHPTQQLHKLVSIKDSALHLAPPCCYSNTLQPPLAPHSVDSITSG